MGSFVCVEKDFCVDCLMGVGNMNLELGIWIIDWEVVDEGFGVEGGG